MDPENLDVSPESSTGTDENTSAASSATENEQPQDLRQKLDKRLSEVKKAAEKPTGDGKTAKTADGEKKAGDAKAQGEKADDKKAKGEDTKTVPVSVVQKEREKRKALQTKLDDADVDARRKQATIDILTEELKREREARVKGAAVDPKDEQIRRFELGKRAEDIERQIADETKAAREEFEHEEAVADLTAQLDSEIKEAVGDESVVGYSEIVAALGKPENANKSPKQIADEKIAVRLETLKKQIVKQRPAFPSTAKPKAGGHHGVRVEPTLDSMRSLYAQIRAQQPTE